MSVESALAVKGYKRIKGIGRGSYGTVGLYQSEKAKREVAIKIIPYDKKYSKDVYIKREITILRNVSHPNIINCYEYFYLDQHIYVVMEYAANGTLGTALQNALTRRRYFSELELYATFVGICLGIEKLHTNSIIHRDLKPENILIGMDGKMKIADFGISKVLHIDDTNITRGIGTPLYAAPEVLRMQPYDFSADIWSLGCIFYEICTLMHPYSGSRNQDELLKRIKLGHKPINSTKLGLRTDVEVLTKMMLQENPNDRYPIQDIITHPCLANRLYHEKLTYNI